MARGISTKDFAYEVESAVVKGVLGFLATIEMDEFNIGTADDQVKKTTETSEVFPFHVSIRQNENKYGIHPRYVVGEFRPDVADENCSVANPKRIVMIPILTIDQFDDLKVYNQALPSATPQPKTTIKVNHTANGSGTKLTYRIIKKVAERMV